MLHTPVLLQEIIDGLDIKADDVIVDATVGSGGHAEAILSRFRGLVTYIGLDQDADSLMRTRERLKISQNENPTEKIFLYEVNFRDMANVLGKAGIAHADKIFFDLGWSTDQFETSGRGFSFQKDEPLSMTFKKNTEGVTADVIVNTWKEETLADIFFGFGGERYARTIAKTIVEARESKPIKTTNQLVAIIHDATPHAYHHRKIHYATKIFQALRIAVNDEYGALAHALESAWGILREGGIIAVISFHSGEDRIVKRFFKNKEKEGDGIIHTKKPIIAGTQENKQNPKARSAKLRIINKLKAH